MRAKNTAGCVSEPSEPTDQVICKEEYGMLIHIVIYVHKFNVIIRQNLLLSSALEPPTLTLDETLALGITVRAGEDVQIQAAVTGKPIPKGLKLFEKK